eukprot:294736-Pyramimonas_sp.AAC.1
MAPACVGAAFRHASALASQKGRCMTWGGGGPQGPGVLEGRKNAGPRVSEERGATITMLFGAIE